MRPQSQTLAKPAPSASSRYITSIAVSSAPRDAGDRNPAPDAHGPSEELRWIPRWVVEWQA